MNLIAKQPIGIMDSGIGGVSVLSALMKKLPYENVVYFGDTAHMPYGKRTLDEVRLYTSKILDFLIDQHCKLIIIACNTASAATEDLLNTHYKDKVKIFNVIDPVVHYVTQRYSHRKVGLLCTDLTHKLGIFERKIEDQGDDIRLISFRASQLAHMIETEFENKEQLKKLIREYFFHHQFKNVEAVILGCTHYLWLKENFIKLDPFIDWIEPSTLLAIEAEAYLTAENNLCRPLDGLPQSEAIFYQSGNNSIFFELANRLTPPDFQKSFIANCTV